jgi:hypothetical protein
MSSQSTRRCVSVWTAFCSHNGNDLPFSSCYSTIYLSLTKKPLWPIHLTDWLITSYFWFIGKIYCEVPEREGNVWETHEEVEVKMYWAVCCSLDVIDACLFVVLTFLKSQLNQCSSRKEYSGGKKVQRDCLKNIKGPLTPHGLWYRHERREFLLANPGVSVIAVNQSNVICSRLVF